MREWGLQAVGAFFELLRPAVVARGGACFALWWLRFFVPRPAVVARGEVVVKAVLEVVGCPQRAVVWVLGLWKMVGAAAVGTQFSSEEHGVRPRPMWHSGVQLVGFVRGGCLLRLLYMCWCWLGTPRGGCLSSSAPAGVAASASGEFGRLWRG